MDVRLLAETQGPLTPPETDESLSSVIDSALPIAGLFIALLAIAIVLLWLSMRRQIKKVDPDLPDGPGDKQRELDAELTQAAEEKGQSESS